MLTSMYLRESKGKSWWGSTNEAMYVYGWLQ